MQTITEQKSKTENYFAYRSFWPEFKAMKEFKNADVNTVCIFAANTDNSLGKPYCEYPPVWRWFDKYDFDSLDRQYDDVLAVNPDAEFICMVDLNTPIWLQRQLSLRGQSAECESFTMLSCACANPDWRKATGDYLEAVLKHMEERYGDRVKAYLLACGQTDEWMDYSKGLAGKFKTQAWKEWRRERGKEAVAVPSIERMGTASFENLIRDPQTEQDIIDYFQFSSDLVIDAVLTFAGKTRSIVHEKRQIGMFFGYILELQVGRLVQCGHLQYERLYSSDDIDFFISPGNYNDRVMGGGSGFMVPSGTLKRNGKGFLHEIDHGTHTYNCNLDEYVSIKWMDKWKDQAETDAGLKREFALATINNTSLWCFDMWGKVFETSRTLDVVKRSREIWDRYTSMPTTPVAEVALIADPHSALYLNDENPIVSKIYAQTRKKLNRLGAPFEVFSFNDLQTVDLSKFKLIIFPGLFVVTPEKLDILQKYVFSSDRTIMFMYAPGVCNGEKLDIAYVKKLTGIEYGTEQILKCQHDHWKAVYTADYDSVTPSVLKDLAKDAGVTMYCDDEVPVFANDKLIAIHVAEGGRKIISIPHDCEKATELYSGKQITVRGGCFSYEFSSPDTAVFEIQMGN